MIAKCIMKAQTHMGGFPTNNVCVHLNLKKVFRVVDAPAGASETEIRLLQNEKCKKNTFKFKKVSLEKRHLRRTA